MIKANTKSFLIILITLLIGMAIGFEINEILAKKKFEKFRDLRKPKGFLGMFIDIIQPEENQKAQVDTILMRFHRKTESIMSESRSRMNVQLDSLRAELAQVLNKEQLKRFDDEAARMKKGIPPQKINPRGGPSDPHGPPRGDIPGGMPPDGTPPGEIPPLHDR